MKSYEPYVPKSIGELLDLFGSMMLSAPTMRDQTGWFAEKTIDTEFDTLNKSLDLLKRKLGEQKHQKLVAMAAEMRMLFEADPEDKTGETDRGREMLLEMEVLLTGRKTYLESKHGDYPDALDDLS